MWQLSSSGCSVSSLLLSFLQTFLRPQETDGSILIWAKELLAALLILTAFWLLAQLIILLLNRYGRKLAVFSSADMADHVIQRAIPHVSRLLTILGLYLAIRSLPLHEKVVQVLSGALFVAMVAIIFNLLYHALDELLQRHMNGDHTDKSALISRNMIPIAEKLAMLFLMGTALIIILKHFNYDIFSVVTALGIGSLAIGLAAKDTLAHMISGFTLMLDQPFLIGDRIKLANGQVGDVIDIGLRSTKIQGPDSTMMIIPNSDLCNSTVINLVRPTSVIQGSITLGVGYGSDIEHVKAVLLEIARENSKVVADPPPIVLFISFGSSALNMLYLFWVDDPGTIGVVTDQLNCAILRRFREEHIEIPFPIRTVVMEKEKPLCPTE
jgi:MscS family membrane protein